MHDHSTCGVYAPVGATANQQSSQCRPSPLGYSCATLTPNGVTIHYTRGGAVPDNACTRGTKSVDRVMAAGGGDLLHFAVENSVQVCVPSAWL